MLLHPRITLTAVVIAQLAFVTRLIGGSLPIVAWVVGVVVALLIAPMYQRRVLRGYVTWKERHRADWPRWLAERKRERGKA